MKRRKAIRRLQAKGLLGVTLLLALLFICAKNINSSKDGKSGSPDSDMDDIEEVAMEHKSLNRRITNEMSAVPELEGLDKKIKNYIRDWHIKGASLAIVRNDSLVYAKGYGWADKELEIPMEPGHIMRVASVSKLITAAGIMVLQDQGKLNIKDKVFGPEGILNDEFFNNLTQCDTKFYDLTVEDILRHRSRFYSDPVFRSIQVQEYMGLAQPPTKEDYFTLVLRNGLRGEPGTATKYSNFGYLVLSEIIEKVSGMPYETFINKYVMYPAGCYDMHIGGVYYKDKRKNEVRYYTNDGEGKFVPDFNNPQDSVERCYGGSNITLLSGAGGWCSSTIELARFVSSINGIDGVHDIISQDSFELMTEYIDDNTFSLGWNDTHPTKGWNRTGTLSGTSALIRHYPDGECWIFVTNTCTYKGPKFPKITDALFTECRKQYSSKLPYCNLFE